MFIVQTVSQIQEAIREKVRELLVIGHLASELKALLESRDNVAETNERRLMLGNDLVEMYDIVDFQNRGRYEHLLLSRKTKIPFAEYSSPNEKMSVFIDVERV